MNIGFTPEATHTDWKSDQPHPLAIPIDPLQEEIVDSPVEYQAEADRYTFETVFAPKKPSLFSRLITKAGFGLLRN